MNETATQQWFAEEVGVQHGDVAGTANGGTALWRPLRRRALLSAWLATAVAATVMAGPVVAVAAGTPSPTAAAVAPPSATRPVLVELFTSQGCSSCPPADAVLRQLVGRPEVLALGFHVDYWDSLGWADPFAQPRFTARQHEYARRRGFQVYTPQLIVDGEVALVGSRQQAVAAAIRTAAGRIAQRPLPAGPDATIRRTQSAVAITVGASPDAADDAAAAKDRDAGGTVWLVGFDRERTTAIERGENAGRRLVYANVVRSLSRVAVWANAPLTLAVPLGVDTAGERLALVVQRDDGRVLAVAVTP